MPVSRAMRRLLQVLEIQEEESRAAMESARGELHRLERALEASQQRERLGRRLVAASAATGEVVDRMAGLEESRAAARLAKALAPRIEEAAEAVEELRQVFLAKRIERRQTETLIEETEAQDKVEAERRGQRDLDDWFLGRHDAREEKPRTDSPKSGS